MSWAMEKLGHRIFYLSYWWSVADKKIYHVGVLSGLYHILLFPAKSQ